MLLCTIQFLPLGILWTEHLSACSHVHKHPLILVFYDIVTISFVSVFGCVHIMAQMLFYACTKHSSLAKMNRMYFFYWDKIWPFDRQRRFLFHKKLTCLLETKRILSNTIATSRIASVNLKYEIRLSKNVTKIKNIFQNLNEFCIFMKIISI